MKYFRFETEVINATFIITFNNSDETTKTKWFDIRGDDCIQTGTHNFYTQTSFFLFYIGCAGKTWDLVLYKSMQKFTLSFAEGKGDQISDFES